MMAGFSTKPKLNSVDKNLPMVKVRDSKYEYFMKVFKEGNSVS
jgi:hypothetical protein